MTLYRARQWGTSEWTKISITASSEDDEGGLESVISSILGSALETSPLHVQFMNEEGEWEDL